MRAACMSTTKSGKTKTVVGTVMRRGLGTIALLITQKDGTKTIRRFDESKYNVVVIPE